MIKRGGRNRKCDCVIKAEAIGYLTPLYAGAQYLKHLDPRSLRGSDILIQRYPMSSFKSLAKSFLLNTGMQLSHRSLSGYEIIQAYLDFSGESEKFSDFVRPDLLILLLGFDPPNKLYGKVLTALLKQRELQDRKTWIYTTAPLSAVAFRDTYTAAFVDLVAKQFREIKPERV